MTDVCLTNFQTILIQWSFFKNHTGSDRKKYPNQPVTQKQNPQTPLLYNFLLKLIHLITRSYQGAVLSLLRSHYTLHWAAAASDIEKPWFNTLCQEMPWMSECFKSKLKTDLFFSLLPIISLALQAVLLIIVHLF